MFFTKKIKELKNNIAIGNNRIETLKSNESELLSELKRENQQFVDKVNNYFDNVLNDNAILLNDTTDHSDVTYIPGWDIDKWQKWKPEIDIPYNFFFGQLKEEKTYSKISPDLYASIDLIGNSGCYFIEGNHNDSNDIYAFLQSLSLRLYTRLLNNVQFTFIDPSGLGKAFPIAKQLPQRLDNTSDLYRLLNRITEEIIHLNQTYGLSDDRMFDSIADTILVNEKFEFIFAANFPSDYDSRTIENLLKIAEQGPIAGKYVFIHRNTDVEIKDERVAKMIEKLSNAHVISRHSNLFEFQGPDNLPIPLSWSMDEKPSDDIISIIQSIIKDNTPESKPLSFTVPDNYWSKSSHEYFETTVGQTGDRESMNIWLGRKQSENSRQCIHGVLAGTTGSGKSNLLHNIILGLATRYSPDELLLSLIDLKEGVEFQVYKHLPHAEFVSLNTTSNLALSVLKSVVDEIERRNEIFMEQYEVSNYEDYRKKTGKEFKLPRKLLIIDEYQRLFIADNYSRTDTQFEASKHLLRISQQGRSAGIHMILGSQDFDVANIMHKQALLNNIHLRIALQIAPEKRETITEFRKEAKLLVAKCERPGQIVINTNSGEDGYNRFGKVGKLEEGQAEQIVNELNELHKKTRKRNRYIVPNIFNGSDQPDMTDNTQFSFLLDYSGTPSKDELEVFAQKPIHQGGLGEVSWYSGEYPMVFWMGQEFNVHGHANIITRRRQRENVLIIGDQNDARYGIKMGVLFSSMFNGTKEELEFFVADKTLPGTPWAKSLYQISDKVIKAKGFNSKYANTDHDITSLLSTLQKNIKDRKALSDEERLHLKTIVFVASDLDRMDDLNLIQNKYGVLEETDLGKQLIDIIIEGPKLGIHTFLSFETVMSMYNVILKKNLEFFRHRVALQMSEQDAFDLVKRRDAARLQNHGYKPIAAFYINIGKEKKSTFKPYIISKGFTDNLIERTLKSTSNG